MAAAVSVLQHWLKVRCQAQADGPAPAGPAGCTAAAAAVAAHSSALSAQGSTRRLLAWPRLYGQQQLWCCLKRPEVLSAACSCHLEVAIAAVTQAHAAAIILADCTRQADQTQHY